MRLYEIKFLNDAKLDLRRVYSRVCTTSGSSARASKVVGRIRKEVDKLAYMPERNAVYTVYETTLIYRYAKVGKYVVYTRSTMITDWLISVELLIADEI